MSILTIQKRLHERGRIRIGQKVATDKGGSRPSKLDRFRFTSADKPAIEMAADLWGGIVEAWESPNGQQWELISESTDLPVVVPPTDFGFSQFMELWSGGGCQRRCDTETELISGGACVCALEDRQQCKPTTRLSVILPDLPGLGLWRLETHGWNAAAELAGTLDLIHGGGRLLPARLRLQQRSAIVDGKTTRFAVPVLDVDVRMHELAGQTKAIDFTIGEITAGANPNITPVPVAELAPGPQPSIREQVATVEEEQPTRRGTQQQIPATGLKPRTAASAEAGESAAPAEPVDPAVERKAKLQRQLMATAAKAFPKEEGLTPAAQKARRDAQRHALTYAVLGQHASSSDMSDEDLIRVTSWLDDVVKGRVQVLERDGQWIVSFNGQEVVVPAEAAA